MPKEVAYDKQSNLADAENQDARDDDRNPGRIATLQRLGQGDDEDRAKEFIADCPQGDTHGTVKRDQSGKVEEAAVFVANEGPREVADTNGE